MHGILSFPLIAVAFVVAEPLRSVYAGSWRRTCGAAILAEKAADVTVPAAWRTAIMDFYTCTTNREATKQLGIRENADSFCRTPKEEHLA